MLTQSEIHPDLPFDEPTDTPAVRYRAISRAAVVSVVLGVMSLVTIFDWWLALVPLAGIMVGWLALRQIHDKPGEVAGLALAWTGLGLCVAFWSLGYGWLFFSHAQEVPFGYQRVDYEELQPDRNIFGQEIPPGIDKLQDKKIFVKGYMKPSRQQTRLKRFILCPAIADCPFCKPNPRPTEMIAVTLTGDMEADYTSHLVRLGGTFKVDPQAPNGIPYSIEADYMP
jgi:hypothetical protein